MLDAGIREKKQDKTPVPKPPVSTAGRPVVLSVCAPRTCTQSRVKPTN